MDFFSCCNSWPNEICLIGDTLLLRSLPILYTYLARANHKMIIEMYIRSPIFCIVVPSTRKHNINQTKQSLINKWFIPCWDIGKRMWWLLTSQFRSCLFWCHLLSDSRASYFPLFLFSLWMDLKSELKSKKIV